MTVADKTITVVGAGFMGAVISTLYAHHGYRVIATDSSADALQSLRKRALPIAATLVDDQASADALVARIELSPRLDDAVRQAFFVHEVIHEDLQAKQELFARLDGLCAKDVVLGTNTSSFKLSDICKDVKLRDRVLGVHYVTPAHIVKVVEIIAADFTPPKLVEWGKAFLKTIDHVGVVCTDTPGFVVNRLQYALLSEAYSIVADGVASRDDVDAAVRLSLGPRLALWGPLLTEDLVVSKKTTAFVWDYLFNSTHAEKFRRPPAVDRFVAEGRLGAMAGRGWYDFGGDYPSVVLSRDNQLKSLLEWLTQNDRAKDFKAS